MTYDAGNKTPEDEDVLDWLMDGDGKAPKKKRQLVNHPPTGKVQKQRKAEDEVLTMLRQQEDKEASEKEWLNGTQIIFLIVLIPCISLCLLPAYLEHRKNAASTDDADPVQDAVALDLHTALTKAMVEMKVTGGGLSWIHIELTSKSPDPLNIEISVGTVFNSVDSRVQNMVVVESQNVPLNAIGDSYKISVSAACVNMRLKEPEHSDTFASVGFATGDLKAVLPHLWGCNTRIRQLAIWTITDNPRSFQFSIRRPSIDELSTIKAIFDSAGISTAKYQAFRSDFSDFPALRALLENED